MIPDDIKKSLTSVRRRGDRSHPLAFVGRTREMQHLQDVVDESKGDAHFVGAACILQGAPGMGKTALCNEFARRTLQDQSPLLTTLEQQGQTPLEMAPPATTLVACVSISPAALSSDPLTLVQAIDSRLRDPDLAVLGHHHHLRTAAAALARRVTRGGALQDLRADGLSLTGSSDLETCLNAYAEHAWTPGTVIVLMVDEAQQCNVEDVNTRNNIRAIHGSNHKARMPLLLFGLPDTGAVLQQLGLFRLTDDAAKTVGRLDKGEGRKALDRTFGTLGLNDPLSDQWVKHLNDKGKTTEEWLQWRGQLIDQLDAASHDFPQHLAVGLTAACLGILKTDAAEHTFDAALLHTIAKDHQRRKNNYYEERLTNPPLAPHALAFGAASALFQRRGASTLPRLEVQELLRVRHQADAASGDLDTEQVLYQAVAKGVLGYKKPISLRQVTPPPIPSMQKYMAGSFQACLETGCPTALALQSVLDRLAPPPPEKIRADATLQP